MRKIIELEVENYPNNFVRRGLDKFLLLYPENRGWEITAEIEQDIENGPGSFAVLIIAHNAVSRVYFSSHHIPLDDRLTALREHLYRNGEMRKALSRYIDELKEYERQAIEVLVGKPISEFGL